MGNGNGNEPRVPLWIFVVTVALCWGGAGAIIGVELARDSQNAVLAGVALWLLTAPIIGFHGAMREVRSWLIRALGGKR